MSEFKDVSGHTLNVGDQVAYCLGGKGTEMRVGEVLRMTTKSVIISGSAMQHRWNGHVWVQEIVPKETIRAFDAVSKVAPLKEEN